MDIIRKTKKNGDFYYINKINKTKINNKKTLHYIKSIKIPPAYKNVKIATNFNSKIQCIGTDTKKRKQYIYNPEYTENQKKVKFADLIYFGKKIKRIRKEIYYNISKCYKNKELIYNKESIISIVLYLIDYCNFRVGCEKYKKLYNSYGVTTLNKNHIRFGKKYAIIEFIGKKGVLNKSKVLNSTICSLLKNLCLKNDDYIFYYYDSKGDKYKISEKHINDYLKKYNSNLTVKMFRTWNTNYILLKELLSLELPINEIQAKKNINLAIKKAAEQMHHSPNVSKQSYVNSEIVELYISNPLKFKKLVDFFRKTNGKLPTISRLLNLILTHIN